MINIWLVLEQQLQKMTFGQKFWDFLWLIKKMDYELKTHQNSDLISRNNSFLNLISGLTVSRKAFRSICPKETDFMLIISYAETISGVFGWVLSELSLKNPQLLKNARFDAVISRNEFPTCSILSRVFSGKHSFAYAPN